MERKDALTDIVEHADGAESSKPLMSAAGDRQVTNQQGEIITLGQNADPSGNKGIPLELWASIECAIVDGIERAFSVFRQKK